MRPQKPPCPKCGDCTNVTTLGGGSLGQYRYICKDVMCNAAWQQVPLHKLGWGERPNPIMKKVRKKRSDAHSNQRSNHSNNAEEDDDLSFLLTSCPVPNQDDREAKRHKVQPELGLS